MSRTAARNCECRSEGFLAASRPTPSKNDLNSMGGARRHGGLKRASRLETDLFAGSRRVLHSVGNISLLAPVPYPDKRRWHAGGLFQYKRPASGDSYFVAGDLDGGWIDVRSVDGTSPPVQTPRMVPIPDRTSKPCCNRS